MRSTGGVSHAGPGDHSSLIRNHEKGNGVDVRRIEVVTQAAPGRVAEPMVVGPMAELDLTAADQVNPAMVKAMRKVGIDISAQTPEILTYDAVRESDMCVTMGCGDAYPAFPGKHYLGWKLTDPAGKAWRRFATSATSFNRARLCCADRAPLRSAVQEASRLPDLSPTGPGPAQFRAAVAASRLQPRPIPTMPSTPSAASA